MDWCAVAMSLISDLLTLEPATRVRHTDCRNMKPSPDYVPVKWRTKIARRWLACKVAFGAALLRCFRRPTAAQLLSLGYQQWDHSQTPDNNHRLWFR
jgi:hypothetical protein